jgi:hypothetical protein
MNEGQLRELLGKGLPKIATASLNAVYPIGFQAVEEPARDFKVEAQAVGSQLIYTRHFQVCSFLIMEAGQIFALGQRAFPKYSRMECPKMVVSANGEALNTIMGKLAYLVGKVDADAEVVIAPPIVLNCTGPNRVAVSGTDSLFLKLVARDLAMLIVASVQRI